MKRLLLALTLAVWTSVGAGCHWQNCGYHGDSVGAYGCSSCGGGGCNGGCGGSYVSGSFFSHRRAERVAAENMPAGPSTAAVGYPYYTVRGPRDFFANEPMPIGY